MIGFQVLWRYGYNNVEEEINAEFDFDFPTEGSSVIASDDGFIFGVYKDCRKVDDLSFFFVKFYTCAE